MGSWMRKIRTFGLMRGRDVGGHWCPRASHSVTPSLLYRLCVEPLGCDSVALGRVSPGRIYKTDFSTPTISLGLSIAEKPNQHLMAPGDQFRRQFGSAENRHDFFVGTCSVEQVDLIDPSFGIELRVLDLQG